MRELEWNRPLLTMALTSGADISMPALEPQEDILNTYVTKISQNVVNCNNSRSNLLLFNKTFVSESL